MRWQYTIVGYGADIGSDNSAWGSGPSVAVADKDALIWRIAEINAADAQDLYGAAYDEAMAVLKNIPATQDEVDEALAALQEPVIVSQPADVEGSVGTPIEFTVGAIGDNLRYQWYLKSPTDTAWRRITASTPIAATKR
jgi:hypothetical protein